MYTWPAWPLTLVVDMVLHHLGGSSKAMGLRTLTDAKCSRVAAALLSSRPLYRRLAPALDAMSLA
jgi:hypothetical protein